MNYFIYYYYIILIRFYNLYKFIWIYDFYIMDGFLEIFYMDFLILFIRYIISFYFSYL